MNTVNPKEKFAPIFGEKGMPLYREMNDAMILGWIDQAKLLPGDSAMKNQVAIIRYIWESADIQLTALGSNILDNSITDLVTGFATQLMSEPGGLEFYSELHNMVHFE